MELEEDNQEVPQESDTIKKTARRVLNVTRWVWLCNELNLSQKLILIFLSHQVKIKTYATRYLENSDIATATGLHSRTVGIHLKWLIESEFIEEVKPQYC